MSERTVGQRRVRPAGPRVRRIDATPYTIPTEALESDGTLAWDETTIIVVEAYAGDRRGIGYSYTDAAAATLIRRRLAAVVKERDALAAAAANGAMRDAVRNIGRPGLTAAAIAAVDIALWDLEARLLELPLVRLIGAVRDHVPVYASGGFTSYDIDRLREQLAGWVARGIPRVKMKVGRHPAADPRRVTAARDAIGPDADLYIDANGAYDRKQALGLAERYARSGVSWFEEPVSADDLAGMRLLRDRAPAGMEIAAGEYGYDLVDFRRLLEAGAVDVLQVDATRCAGITGLLAAATLCEAHTVPLSAHAAPAIHVHVACALGPVRHIEYFYDHVRIERRLFEGTVRPVAGMLEPDRTRPGLGLELKTADAERYRTG